MGSLFIPADYEFETVSRGDMQLASIAWGFTLGFGLLTSVKAATQSIRVWRRTRGVTTYIVLAWGEMVVSIVFAFICWFYLDGAFQPSFAFFFSILTLWALQVQFLLQIIINRIGLLIPDKRKVWRIKWGVAALITCINISVYCIWVPARLQISDTYIHVNEIWDRCEKGIYLIVDGILNAYFLRLVQSKLISAGMTKYKRLFNFNAFIVLISLAMDVLIIAMMSLPNTFVYMQFHPVAYIVKLNIEMSMAELITKVARDTQSAGSDPYSHELSKATWNKGGAASKSASARVHSHAGHNRIMSGEYADGRARAAENGNMNWALRSNGVYTAHVQGGSQPQQNRRQLSSTNEESNPSQQRSVFDDTNESQEVDFADMLKGGSYGNADSNGEDGRIRVVKTVEVEVETSNDGLADSSSDSEESTRKLPVYKTT